MARKDMYTISGVAHWAKVLGDPVPNYAGDGREWTIDVTPDEEGIRLLNEIGLGGKLKNKDDERGQFIAFRQKEKRRDGSLNRRIAVVDEEGQPWPPNRLIGNGTRIDLKFEKKDYGPGKHPGVYPQAIRIRELQEYNPVHFAPIEKAQNPQEGKLPAGMEPELDDEFPV